MDSARDRFDLLGNLPLELGQQIAQHLPLHHIFQARRVSHKRSRVLSSPTVELMLRSWYIGSKLPLHVPEGYAPEGLPSVTAEHVDAFCNGTAFSMAVEQFPGPLYHDFDGNVDYAAGVMAWTAEGVDVRDHIYFKCLISDSKAASIPG